MVSSSRTAHSLPAPDAIRNEYVIRHHGAPADSERQRKRFLMTVAVSILVLAMIIGFSTSLATRRKGKAAAAAAAKASSSSSGTTTTLEVSDPDHPDNPYTGEDGDGVVRDIGHDPNLSRLENAKNFLTIYWDRAPLDEDGTAQSQAVKWIADEDRAQLPIPQSTLYDFSFHFLQRYVLAVFYYSLGGADWTYKMSFLRANSVCKWNQELTGEDFTDDDEMKDFTLGVSCNSNEEVETIFMPGVGLVGQIPHEMGYLLALKHLSFYYNDIAGPLPGTFRFLEQLEFLGMESNLMSGPIPDWLNELTQLQYLDLGDNQFTGEIPPLYALTNLKEVSLSSNSLTGPVDVFNYLPALERLFLQDNDFTADVNDDLFSNLQNLEVLDMSQNQLVGYVPEHFYNLRTVDLHNNSLAGDLPAVAYSDLPIRYLNVNDNEIIGEIPSAIGYLSKLVHLDLSNNLLEGPIPESQLDMLLDLRVLHLERNPFVEGSFPTIWNLSKLKELSLAGTNRFGEIPEWVGQNLKHLVLLDLHDNRLTGNIPVSLGQLNKLEYLMLNRNRLSGALPQTFYFMENIDVLLLDKNDLSGDINAMCSDEDDKLAVLIADCKNGDEVICANESCCTVCCDDEDWECNSGGMEISLDDGYAQDAYIFSENFVFQRMDPVE